MAFTYGQLPMVVSFHDALEIYNNTKPIRGRSPEVRPLGLRRRHEASIDVRHEEGVVTEVILSLFRNPVISFRAADPHVIHFHAIDKRYLACTTRASFIESVIGLSCRLNDHKIKIYQGDHVIEVFDGMKAQRDIQTRRLTVLNPQTRYAYRVSRAAINDVVSKYDEFINYCKSMAKIAPEMTFNPDELKTTTEEYRGIYSILDLKPDFHLEALQRLNVAREEGKLEDALYFDPDNNGKRSKTWIGVTHDRMRKQYEALTAMLNTLLDACNLKDYEAMNQYYKQLVFSTNGRHIKWGIGVQENSKKVRFECDHKSITELFREIVKLIHADKVLKKEVLPEGKSIRDKNEKYALANQFYSN